MRLQSLEKISGSRESKDDRKTVAFFGSTGRFRVTDNSLSILVSDYRKTCLP